jgi:hypothetical protein
MQRPLAAALDWHSFILGELPCRKYIHASVSQEFRLKTAVGGYNPNRFAQKQPALL